MERTYAVTLDVANAEGLVASKYVNAAGNGTLTVEGTEAQFANPDGQTFSVRGGITKAWDMDGRKLDPDSIAKMVFGPIQYTLSSGAKQFSGDGWNATLSIKMSDDQRTLQAIVEGSATGFKRFAAKNIRVILNGVIKV